MQPHLLRLPAAVLICLSCVVASAGEPLRVGVFDTKTAGGKGASIEGLVRGLKKHGYHVGVMTDMHMLTLLQHDVVYLSDMHAPGNVRKQWRKTLQSFVESGGCVLQTWHHHILGQVGVGVLRIYGSRNMHVKPGHDAVKGVSDFKASFKDHIIEKVGPAGTVLLTNDKGQPVAVAGRIGRGKVISTGLALAIPNGRASREPRGEELKLLKSFLAWLRPEAPKGERLAKELKSPQLWLAPAEVLTAAGFPATFGVRLGYPGRPEVHVTCEGGTVETGAVERFAEAGGGAIASFKVVVETEAGRATQRELRVKATVGDHVMEARATVRTTYGATPANERRGVWLHVREDRHPKVVMPVLKELGIDFAVLRIAGGTAAFFAGSKVQPDIQDPLAPDGDWLAEAVKHAHANGIEMHPYVNNCVVEGRTSPASLKRLRDAGRLQVSPTGQPLDWFCPSQEANLRHMERVMVEIATQYDVDGVQYDFIRYPNASGCFCDKCRALFEKETGRPAANWPKDVVDGPRHAEWVEFRCERISQLVRRTSTRIRREAPKVKISAAVFRDWPACRESNGQDWVRWCKEGWLDFVCPMNYTLDAKTFAERAAIHRKAVPEGFPIVQGIGIHSGQGGMKTPGELAVQIALARQHGASGFVGFCYNPGHTKALFGPLKEWLGQ